MTDAAPCRNFFGQDTLQRGGSEDHCERCGFHISWHPKNQGRCNYLCIPHQERCDLDIIDHAGIIHRICHCEKCPTRIK